MIRQRLCILNDAFTFSLYRNICRSLFEKDKLLFSFLLCVRILMSGEQGTPAQPLTLAPPAEAAAAAAAAAGGGGGGQAAAAQVMSTRTSTNKVPVKLDMIEWRFLLTGGVASTELPPNSISWLPAKAWGELYLLSTTKPEFKDLRTSIREDEAGWKAVYDAESPQHHALPGKWDTALSSFQKMCVLRCLRPDRVVPGIMEFVEAEMGHRFVEPPPFDRRLKNCRTCDF